MTFSTDAFIYPLSNDNCKKLPPRTDWPRRSMPFYDCDLFFKGIKVTDDPFVLLGRRIAYLRKHRKQWSQDRLSQEAHVARGHLADIELGRKNISFRTMLKISKALEMPVSELLAYEDIPANEDYFRD